MAAAIVAAKSIVHVASMGQAISESLTQCNLCVCYVVSFSFTARSYVFSPASIS
jgi:hypothetical protein